MIRYSAHSTFEEMRMFIGAHGCAKRFWNDARAVIYASQLFNSEIIERAVPDSARFVSFFISPVPSIDNYAIAIRAWSQ